MKTVPFFFRITVPLLLCACLAHTPSLQAQGSLEQSPYALRADSLRKAGRAEQALNMLAAAKAQLEGQGQQQTSDYVAVLWATGMQYLRMRDIPAAEPLFTQAIDLQTRVFPDDREDRILLLDARATSYEYTDLPKAILLYEQILELRKDVAGEDSKLAARGYYNLATALMDNNDFEKASDYCRKAIRSLKNAGLTSDPDYGGFHQVLGLIYQNEGDIETAVQYYTQALPLMEESCGESIETAKCLSTIGETYAKKGDIDNALRYQLASATMFEKVDTADGRYLSSAYFFLGVTYNLGKQPDKAIEYLNRAQNVGAQPGEHKPLHANLAFQLSKSHALLKDYTQALALADSALLSLRARQKGVSGKLRLWYALLSKADVLASRFRQNGNTADLLEAGSLLSEAKGVISAIIGNFQSERDKRSIYRDALTGFDQAIGLYTQLFKTTGDPAWLKTAFEFSETGKGLLLYQQVLESKTRRKAVVPEVLRAEEQSLGEQITVAEKHRFEQGEKASEAEKDHIDEELFTLKNRYERVRQDIQAVCPDYFQVAAFPDVQTSALQTGLAPDEGLLEFFLGDTSVLAFLLRPDTLVYRQLGSRKDLESNIALFREAMGRYFTAPVKSSDLYLRSAGDYTATAYALYQTLLAPFGNLLPARLTIVPDGALAYLPFEALLIEKPERPDRFHLHHYLVKDFTLHYGCSATLLREMKKQHPDTAKVERLFALAPFFDGSSAWRDSLLALQSLTSRADLAPLPFSGEEVYRIAALTGGKALAGAEATKSAFLLEAAQYRVLHLATHAQANDKAGDYSFLAFAPDPARPNAERLYVSEIYDLRLEAELVTLSACETGLGQFQRGEGIVSIARAFASAGAHSIVQSQWAVNDAQTRSLMELFYQNLKKGLPKDVALQQARLEYLRRFRGETAHPYFWAGFILIGDNTPLAIF